MLKLLTPPQTEPVTLSEVKVYMRVTATDEDSLIQTLISAARHQAEEYTRRAFILQTWQMWIDDVAELDDVLEIPLPPLFAVNSVKYYDNAGTEYTYSSSNYFQDTVSEPGRIYLKNGAAWPTSTRRYQGMVVEFQAGYGSSPTDVPSPIRTALFRMIATNFEQREDIALGKAMIKIPQDAKNILDLYKVWTL